MAHAMGGFLNSSKWIDYSLQASDTQQGFKQFMFSNFSDNYQFDKMTR